MRKSTIKPKDVESPFAENEMFFSSTDLKGIIQSCNDVFVRISKYSREELIGKPHNIIRHPDMPRAVFKLLWDYIQSGKTIVAYVKNMAKDGSYYWVLATVFPVKDMNGNIIKYLSIRIKPTTKYFATVKKLYKEMLDIEKEKGMEEAEKYLISKIREFGFSNYDDFMMTVFIEEFREKIDAFNKKSMEEKEYHEELNNLADHLGKILSVFKEVNIVSDEFSGYRNILISNAKNISNFTEDIRIIALNASVESLRLGSSGTVFSVLAQEMRKNAEVSAKYISGINDTINKSTSIIKTILFYLGISNLQILMLKELLSVNNNHEDYAKDLEDFKYLLIHSLENLKNSNEMLENLHTNLEKILDDIDKILSILEKLEFLHVNGKIESAHLDEAKFGIIFNQVKSLVSKSQSSILEIKKPTEQIIRHIFSFENSIKDISKSLETSIRFLDVAKNIQLSVG